MRARAAEASDRRCRAGGGCGGSGGGRWGLMRVRTNVRANGARTFLYLLSPRWRRQAGARAHSRGTAYMVRAEYKCGAKTHARTPRMRAFYSIPNIDGKHQRKTRPFIHSMCVPAFVCIIYVLYGWGMWGEGKGSIENSNVTTYLAKMAESRLGSAATAPSI